MLDYGRFDHGRMKPGLGDWKDEDQVRRGAGGRAAAAARRDPPVAARAVRRLGLRARARGAARVVAARCRRSPRSPSSSRSTTRGTTSTTASARCSTSRSPADEYEVIFVDDGSTDATPARLDALAAEHAHVRVEHIPNSGWPGRPRNVGIELSRGEFVYFVDNDDWIGREALERMHAMAVRDEADIVIGKVVGHGKSVPRNLFRRNRTGVDLELGRAGLAAHAAQAVAAHVPRRAGPALPRGPAAARGPRVRDARVLRRAAHLGARRLPLLPLGAARSRRQRVVGAAGPAVVLRVHARGARRRRRAHRARPVPRPPLLALVPGQDAQPRREDPLQPGPRAPPRAVRGDARARRRALPRERRRDPAVQPAGALAAAARRRLRGAGGAGRLRDRAARAGARASPCARSRAAPSWWWRRSSSRCGSGARASGSCGGMPGSTRPRRSIAARCSCCSSGARRRRSTACRREVERAARRRA